MVEPPDPRRGRVAERTLLALLGFWICLVFAMGFVAAGNFHVTDPEALRRSAEVFAPLAEGEPRREALRYVASELNRFFFARYDVLDLVVAVTAVLLLLRVRDRPRFTLVALLLCLGVALASTLYITPTLIEQGRAIDFVPRDPAPPGVAAFYRLHGVDIVLEMIKLVLLGGVVVAMVRRGRGAT